MAAALAVAACELPGTDHGHVEQGQLAFAGTQRTYRMYVPPSPQRPAPLVLLLHGAGGDGKSMEVATGFDAEAERYGFLAAYPDGYNRSWNAGFCCPRPIPVASDDVGFLSALIDEIGRRHPVDPKRVYAAGHSNGGYLAYRLACALSSRLAAIAAVAADSQECLAGEPTSPVSVLHVHGTNDNRNNGRMQALRSGVWVETALDAAEQWSRLDGCAPSPGVSVSGRVTRSDWQSCGRGTVVTSYSVLGGDHGWPRSAPDTTRVIADFFRANRQAAS